MVLLRINHPPTHLPSAMVAHQRLHPGIETGFQYLQFRKKSSLNSTWPKNTKEIRKKKHWLPAKINVCQLWRTVVSEVHPARRGFLGPLAPQGSSSNFAFLSDFPDLPQWMEPQKSPTSFEIAVPWTFPCQFNYKHMSSLPVATILDTDN